VGLKLFAVACSSAIVAIAVLAGLGASRAGALSGHARAAKRSVATARRLPAGGRSHIETWAFDDGCNDGGGTSRALVRGWVTFAESNCGTDSRKARSDCHAGHATYCDVMQYLDTDWAFAQDGVRMASVASGDWWLHERAPNQGVSIFSDTLGGGFAINQSIGAVRSFFRAYVQGHFNADDGLMMDWQSPSLRQELYYSTCGCTSTSEIRSDAALRRAHEAMSAALRHRNGAPFIQADNALTSNPWQPQGLDMLSRSAGVDGLIAEGEPVSDGTLDPNFSTLLDEIAYVDNRTTAFVVLLGRASSDAPYQAQSRRVQEATILLGYRAGHLVDWPDMEQGSRDLAVWPEEGIYPTRPIESMRTPGGRGCLAGTGEVCSRGGHTSIQVAPGVYRREFGACYDRRASFGRCAAIVNTTAAPVVVRSSWLRRSYHHEITLMGGDVESGGTVDVAGAWFAAGSTVVGPGDALLLAR
jgi:hypothetical protein